jgi:hypothetical protein
MGNNNGPISPGLSSGGVCKGAPIQSSCNQYTWLKTRVDYSHVGKPVDGGESKGDSVVGIAWEDWAIAEGS